VPNLIAPHGVAILPVSFIHLRFDGSKGRHNSFQIQKQIFSQSSHALLGSSPNRQIDCDSNK
jgi:hypothetical protein